MAKKAIRLNNKLSTLSNMPPCPGKITPKSFRPKYRLMDEKIKSPLFIAQGANDPRVNKAESDQIVEALKKRGVKVEYMVKDNEGHGFQNEENQKF
jgi:predicted esterase